jgi:hypothetical protein
MPRLPLGDLEAALKDPRDYRNKIDDARSSRFRASYFGFLRFALLKYHDLNDIVEARRYLVERLERFKSAKRRAETLKQFEWYVEEHIGRNWPTFRTRLRVQVLLPNWAPGNLRCSGEITRVDIIPQGGYAAWLLKSREPNGWEQQLQMPLIQDTLSRLLKAPAEEVQVGIYSFQERLVASRVYTFREIQRSHDILNNLLREMGY